MLALTRFPGARSGFACAIALLLVACSGAPLDDAQDAAPPTPMTADDAGDGAANADAGRDASPDVGPSPQGPDASDAGDSALGDDAADASADAEVHDAATDAADGETKDGGTDAADDADRDAVADAGDAAEDATDAAGPDAEDAAPDAEDAAPDAPDGSDAGDAAPLDQDGDGVPDYADCAPLDHSAWQLLPYSFRDADGDGRTVPAPSGATVCTGAALPSGYLTIAGDPDCDDTHADVWQLLVGYLDSDHDGVGAGAPVSICSGNALPAGYVTSDSDCAPDDHAAFQLLSYIYRDADGDGRFVVAPSGSLVCAGAALPPGYGNTAGEIDCDDSRADVWAWLDGYPDADGDGVGDSNVERLCTNGQLPAGYVVTDGDCAPSDGTRWQMLRYAYRDADGDGYTVASAGSICAGKTLPAGYATQPNGDDCNDADRSVWVAQTLFPDDDGDGVGAGAAVSLCVAVSPKGYSTTGDDCAPADSSRWALLPYSYRDADGDAHYVAESGAVCTGKTLPVGYATSASAMDCDDMNAAIYDEVQLYVDADGDGVGAGSASAACIGSQPPPGFSLSGDDCAPADRLRYTLTPYAFVDRDGDGATVPENGAVCSDGTLAPPYFATAHGLDCDDAVATLDHFGPVYLDGDGDGFGAGRAIAKCLGSAIPAGYSRYGTDEDDGNVNVTENLDDDLDYAF
jgi:hypothetical protein